MDILTFQETWIKWLNRRKGVVLTVTLTLQGSQAGID